METTKYIVITATTVESLQDNVNGWIKLGYKVSGSMTHVYDPEAYLFNHKYCQPMIKN